MTGVAVDEAVVAELRARGRYLLCPARVGAAPSPQAVEREFLARHRTPWRRALSSAAARWYVVACEPQREYRVQETLRRDGFETLLPERIVVRPALPGANGRRRTVPARREKGPLLPGYLMVRFALDDAAWHRIVATQAVEGILGMSGRPVALSDQDIERLHRLIAEHGVLELRADGSVKRDFLVGEVVRIITDALLAGVWAGREARYVGVGEGGTIKLSLDILGRPSVLPISEALVVPVDGDVPA